jgi:hypothetical protein
MTTRAIQFVRKIPFLDGNSPPQCGGGVLIAALVRHSPLRRSELEYLIVRRTAATLPVELRDAYCPECLREDRARGLIYRRRAWLDAWVMTCDRHGCPLRAFEPIFLPLART